MPRYIITSATTGNEVDVTYNDLGQLTAVQMSGDRDKEQHVKAWNILPLFHHDMVHMVQQYKTLTIREVPTDLSFKTFYNLYGRKTDPDLAEKAWAKLSDSDRMAALAGIKNHDLYLQQHGTAKPYPVRYITKRIWEWEDVIKAGSKKR